jgi:hypothetical protein
VPSDAIWTGFITGAVGVAGMAATGLTAVRLGTVDVNALRHFRANAKWGNWMKDLTTEQYRLIYEEPIYPKNLYAERAPYKHAEYHSEVLERQRELLRERGVYAEQDAGSPASEPA